MKFKKLRLNKNSFYYVKEVDKCGYAIKEYGFYNGSDVRNIIKNAVCTANDNGTYIFETNTRFFDVTPQIECVW